MSDDNNNPPTQDIHSESGATVAPSIGAAGQSGPAAKQDGPPKPRFTIREKDASGPVRSFADVKVGRDGVGTTDNAGIAYHCVLSGYEVLDASIDDQPYTGAPAPGKPVNA